MFRKIVAGETEFDSSSESHEAVEERNLIRSAQQGDHGAFRVLYDAYRDRLYNLAYYMLKDSHLAEDAIQSIFLKIYRGLPFYRFESSFLTWAYRIAINEVKNQRRNRKRDLPLAVLTGTSREVQSTLNPQEEQARQQRETIVRHAVLELSPKMRTVIVLKYIDGLAYDEVASILGCSAGTVASRLNRALVKLESVLAPFKSFL